VRPHSVIPLVAIAAFTAGTPQPPSQTTFRSGVNLVLVDMRVASGEEQVPDLRADEITLLVDGNVRPIVSLDYYRTSVAGSATKDARTSGRPQQPGQAASGEARTRRIAIVVDRDSIESGEARQIEKTARSFIERLPPLYAVAVATLPLRDGIRFEPDRRDAQRALTEAFSGTTRRGLGLEGIAGFGCTGAEASSGCGTQGLPDRTDDRVRRMNATAERQIRGRAVLADLLWLFRALADGPSDVVLVTGGLPQEERLQPEIEKALAAARSANVHVHSIRIADLTRVRLPQQGSRQEDDPAQDPRILEILQARPSNYGLPAETGGLEEDGSVSGEGFFKRLARELSGAYVLAFEPLPSERDGQPHRIEIRLPDRKHTTIRARKVFVLPPPTQHTATTREAPSALPAQAPVAMALPPIAEVAPSLISRPPGGREGVAILRGLVEGASAYVDQVERSLPTVVLEEQYVQLVKRWTGAAPAEDQEAELEWRSAESPPANAASGILRRRQLQSDVLLVQTPGKAWIGYRDVAEVDGAPIRDRAVRVQRLFMSSRTGDRRQLQRIADESARLNLGVHRNINTPTFPLWLLLAQNVGRFEWTLEGDKSGGGCCAVVGFSEVSTPTVVRTSDRRDVRLSGRFWIEPGNGRVWRATLRFKEDRARLEGEYDVRYGPLSDLDVLVPIRLWEWTMTPDPDATGRQAYVEGRASYANVRRFTVRTEESVK
jgi:VWFA-related protein